MADCDALLHDGYVLVEALRQQTYADIDNFCGGAGWGSSRCGAYMTERQREWDEVFHAWRARDESCRQQARAAEASLRRERDEAASQASDKSRTAPGVTILHAWSDEASRELKGEQSALDVARGLRMTRDLLAEMHKDGDGPVGSFGRLLIGSRQPAISKLLTNGAILRLRAEYSKAMLMLQAEMVEFGGVALSDRIAADTSRTVSDYWLRLATNYAPERSAAPAAYPGMEEAQRVFAEVQALVGQAIAAERRVEAARQAAQDEANRQRMLAEQARAAQEAYARAAAAAADARATAEQARAAEEADAMARRERQRQIDEETDDIPTQAPMRTFPSFGGAYPRLPQVTIQPAPHGSNCVSSAYHTCGVQ
jgi:hypothetical protein